MENYAIEMKNITLAFARKVANDNVTLQLKKGEGISFKANRLVAK